MAAASSCCKKKSTYTIKGSSKNCTKVAQFRTIFQTFTLKHLKTKEESSWHVFNEWKYIPTGPKTSSHCKFWIVLGSAQLLGLFYTARPNPITSLRLIYRHGERTPITMYPNDPYKNSSYWPEDWGQLTNAGKLHHFLLGHWLRLRYNHLYSEDYNHKDIYIQSTDVDRTLMSAEANTAGMFPPDSKDRWGNIKWQPIPVHTIPKDLDKLLSMEYPCKKYDKLLHRFKQSKQMEEINQKYKDLYQYLSSHIGKNIHDLEEIQHIHSNLYIEKMANLTLPKWTEKVFPEPLTEAAGLSFAISTYTTELKRLKGGPLLKHMLYTMKRKINGEEIKGKNITVFSAHDTQISNFLNTIGTFNFLPPPFAATILVELRMSPDNKTFVTFLYKNSSNPDGSPHLLTVPGCQAACHLDDLNRILEPVIPYDWDSECHEHELFDLSLDQPYNSVAIVAIVTAVLIVFFMLAVTSLCWHKQKPVHAYKKLKVEPL